MLSHTVYIALGTNLGDRLTNLNTARTNLAPTVRILVSSPVYETPPWGYLDQPAFLNQAVKAETDLPPEELLTFLKRLEVQMGRQMVIKNGPRSIDLDILFYDNLILETPELTIPHPGLHERGFVLVPLADIAPDFCHPVLGKTTLELLEDIDPDGVTRYG